MAHVIRCYDTFGRLLYIAGTVSLPAPRIKTLRKEPWWPLVDQGKLLVEKVSGVNLPQRLSTAIVRERPKYYRDMTGSLPYHRVRPRLSDYERHLRSRKTLTRPRRSEEDDRE